jgi:hypothetical protein
MALLALWIFFAGMAWQAAPPAGASAHRIEELTWFSGAWEIDDGKTRVEEYWTPPAGSMMLGMGRSVRDEKTVFFEFLRIEQRPDGIYYVAQPRGRPPVDFRLDSVEGQSATFVNPGHADHLKRIIYRRNPDGGLSARVEGVDNGKAFAQDFSYRPAKPL